MPDITLTDLAGKYDLSAGGSLKIGGLELEGFKTATLTLSAETIDNGTRLDNGWQSSMPSNRSGVLSVTCNKIKHGDAAETGCQAGCRGYFIGGDFMSKGVKIIYKSAPDSPTYYTGDDNPTVITTGFEGVFVMTSYAETQQSGGEAVEITMEFASNGAIIANAT